MKTIYLSLLSAAVIGSGLLIVPSTFAEDKKPQAEKPAKKKSAFFPFRGKVKSVDTEKGTITLTAAKGKPDRVFLIVEGAKLTLDGEKAQLSAIKPDMYTGGRAKRISDTKVEAHTINVKSKAPERKKPAKKKEA